MIVVNVNVPALEKVYNFSLEERAKVSDLIEELVELIAQKEHIQFSGNLDGMVLCAVESGTQCDWNRCLNDYGIHSGAELVLV